MTEFLVDPVLKEKLEAARRTIEAGGLLLLVGEPGSGREALARAVHRECSAAAPLAVLDGDALETADAGGGTVLIAEIDRFDAAQHRCLDRFVDRTRGRVDVIMTAAPRAVAADFHARMAQCSVHLPPLRQRPQAIPDLLHAILSSPQRGERGPLRVSQAAMDLLVAYDWPGNIAELESVAARLRSQVAGAIVSENDLPPQIRWFSLFRSGGAGAAGDVGFDPFAEEFQFRLIAEALRRTQQR